MYRFVARRLLWLVVGLIAANLAGFTYAHFANYLQQRRNPFFAPSEPPAPLVGAYVSYLIRLSHLDFGSVRIGVGLPVGDVVWRAALASAVLLLAAFVVSVGFGLLLGMRAVRASPAGIAPWLAPLSTVGLATPSFYLGGLLIAAVLAVIERLGPDAPKIPVFGIGLDGRLLLPVLALMARPTVQVAVVTANAMATELDQRYVVTARAFGHSDWSAQWRHALANVRAPIVLAAANSFRLLLAELIVVEWLFGWPGLGRLLASILIPSQSTASPESAFFLNPPALALALSVVAGVFLGADLVASGLAQWFDPRLRAS